MALSLFAMQHPVPCLGIRVASADGVLAYTGDTGWCAELLDLARQANVLLCDASTRDPSSLVVAAGHLTAGQAGAAAAQAGAKRLLLTHLGQQDAAWRQSLVDDAMGEFHGPVEVARHGAMYAVGSVLVPTR